MGQLKPVEVAAPPPGEIGSYVLLPLSALALFLALRTKTDQPRTRPRHAPGAAAPCDQPPVFVLWRSLR